MRPPHGLSCARVPRVDVRRGHACMQELEKGYLGPDDTLTIKVVITVKRDVHYAYDSRKETG